VKESEGWISTLNFEFSEDDELWIEEEDTDADIL
jgi:hypothetical protein